jgi:hypothetical protein
MKLENFFYDLLRFKNIDEKLNTKYIYQDNTNYVIGFEKSINKIKIFIR